MHARRSVLALLMALGLALTACGGGGENKGAEAAGETSSEKGSPSSEAIDIKEMSRDKVPEGGTLRWPLTEIPPNFNYNQIDGTLRDNADVIEALIPGVFRFDAKAQPTVNKDFAESAEVTATDPKQVVTYRLNPKATWSDGKPITVADFEAQAKALNGRTKAFKISSANGYEQIESVAQGRDDREVVVTFAQPYADWQGLFDHLYPADTNNNPDVFNDGWKDKPPVTAGPFRWENLDKTAKTITLVRDEKWWGDKAKLDRIIYRAIDADAHVDALANHEVDFIDVGPDVNKLARAQSAPGVTIRRAGGPNFRQITINGTSEALKDVKVRKALGLAINRTTIAKVLLGPLGVAAKPLNNHLFMANQKGYEDNSGDLGKPSTNKAKALLDEAGWRLEGATRKKDGKELAIRFVIPTGVASSKQESELVQGMLKDVGVKVNIDAVPSDDFFEKYVNVGSFDFTVFSWIGTPFPISSAKSIYVNPKPGPDGSLVIQQNYARIGSPEIDGLFDKATSEFDLDKAHALGNQIDALIWDEVHSFTLYQRPDIIAAQSTLVNFGAFGFSTPPTYEDIGFTK
jgi:peptide/nickel transport system substrate-binding protein